MDHKQDHSTTYAGILHYTKLSRGSRTSVRESFFRGFTVMNIRGGNSTDDPIEYRELAAANQRGESKYSNEHRREKHFEVRDPSSLRALYPITRPNRFRDQRSGTTQTIILLVF